MPIYEYRDAETGAAAEVRFEPGKAPDQLVLKRVRIPSGVGICTGARPPTGGEQLLAGYHKAEQRPGGLPRRPGGFTAAQIKHAASLPDA